MLPRISDERYHVEVTFNSPEVSVEGNKRQTLYGVSPTLRSRPQ